jgi:hypothetical protein
VPRTWSTESRAEAREQGHQQFSTSGRHGAEVRAAGPRLYPPRRRAVKVTQIQFSVGHLDPVLMLLAPWLLPSAPSSSLSFPWQKRTDATERMLTREKKAATTWSVRCAALRGTFAPFGTTTYPHRRRRTSSETRWRRSKATGDESTNGAVEPGEWGETWTKPQTHMAHVAQKVHFSPITGLWNYGPFGPIGSAPGLGFRSLRQLYIPLLPTAPLLSAHRTPSISSLRALAAAAAAELGGDGALQRLELAPQELRARIPRLVRVFHLPAHIFFDAFNRIYRCRSFFLFFALCGFRFLRLSVIVMD